MKNPKKIPEGFVRSSFIQMLRDTASNRNKMENGIIRLMVRDFYIFYSVKKTPGVVEWITYSFYFRPIDEVSAVARLSMYCQAMFKYYTPKRITESVHTLPSGFPECINIKFPDEEKEAIS